MILEDFTTSCIRSVNRYYTRVCPSNTNSWFIIDSIDTYICRRQLRWTCSSHTVDTFTTKDDFPLGQIEKTPSVTTIHLWTFLIQDS